MSFYLKQCITSSFNFVSVDTLKIHTHIVNLAAKNSSGPDSISSKLLKRLSKHIVSPLTVMINQCLTTGIFPRKLQMAKVIPIYEKDENSVCGNYRPIFLLCTVSKIFEKLFLNKYMITSIITNYFMAISMGLERVTSPNWLLWVNWPHNRLSWLW